VLDKLKALRGPGESYSDVIIRLVVESKHKRQIPDSPKQ
jgi:hypothetical protein